MKNNLEELLEQSKQEVAKAIASIYTVEQLSAAIKIRYVIENSAEKDLCVATGTCDGD